MLVSHAIPSLRMVVAGEVRRIVFSELGAVVTTRPPRPTITTMGSLPFEVRLHSEGAMDVQLKAHESSKTGSMAAPHVPFQQGKCLRTSFICCRPNFGPHGALKAPLPHRDWNMQVVGY